MSSNDTNLFKQAHPSSAAVPLTASASNNVIGTSLFDSVRKAWNQRGNNVDLGQQFWMPDSIGKLCYECNVRFTTIRRRHHCRACGQIFCSQCCHEMVDAKEIVNQNSGKEVKGLLRVCKHCYNYILSTPRNQRNLDPESKHDMKRNNTRRKHHSSQTSTPIRNVTSASMQISPLSTSFTSSITPSTNNRWSFSSMFGRKTSTTSLSDIGRSQPDRRASNHNISLDSNTINEIFPKRHLSIERPLSVASIDYGGQHRRYSSQNNFTLGPDGNLTLLSSTSFDNFRNMMAEMDETIDGTEPGWVKEIFEAKQKSKVDSCDIGLSRDEIEDDDDEVSDQIDPDLIDNLSLYNSSEDEEEDGGDSDHVNNDGDHPIANSAEFDVSPNVTFKLNSVIGGPMVRYSPVPRTTLTKKNSLKLRRKSTQLLRVVNNDNDIDEPGILRSSSRSRMQIIMDSPSSYYLLDNFIPEAKSFFDSDFALSGDNLEKVLVNDKSFSENKFNDDDNERGDINTTLAIDSPTNVTTMKMDPNDFSNDSGAVNDLTMDKQTLVFHLLDTIYDRHSTRILQQILTDRKLSLDWLSVLNDIAKQISNVVTLDHHPYLYSIDNYYEELDENGVPLPTNKEPIKEPQFWPMDVRQRIKIKTILNGSKNECNIVNGVVFTKNVVNRKMRTLIDKPKILLFACSIGFDERRRSLATNSSTTPILKMTMFDSMRMQETNYIENLVAKIASFKPDIIFVQGSVCQMARDLLNEKYSISVVLNVKRSILERIALFTSTYLIPSSEMMLNSIRVGVCGRFRLQEYVITKRNNNLKQMNNLHTRIPNKKTLMFLEGCLPNIGCTVILRGSSRFAEFKQLKHILTYMIFVHYNNRLEKAFHTSTGCIPIEGDNWNSLEELWQHATKVRRRINSSRSVCSTKLSVDEKPCNLNLTQSLLLNDTGAKSPKLTTIKDNSDPLRAAIENDNHNLDFSYNQDNEALIQFKSDQNQLRLISEKLEQLIGQIPLSCSPLIRFPLPHMLQSNINQLSSLRNYFPIDLFISDRLQRELTSDNAGISANEIYQSNDPVSEEKDDDYANFIYLISEFNDDNKNALKFSDDDNIGGKEQRKLSSLRNLLTMRYMVSKQHPLLVNDDYDFKKYNKQFVADFRANGPILRCAPDIFARKYDGNLKSKFSNKIPTKQAQMSKPPTESLSHEAHQQIVVLFSSFTNSSKVAPEYCFKPRLIEINYYGKNDMSLGAFLFGHYFIRTRFPSNSEIGTDARVTNSPSRRIICPNQRCGVSMNKHWLRFTHGDATVTVVVNRVQDRKIPTPNRMVTWTFCTRCFQKSAFGELTPDALAMSFGKFLELKFYSQRYFNSDNYFENGGHSFSSNLPSNVTNESEGQSNKSTTDNDNPHPSGSKQCRHSPHQNSYQFIFYHDIVVAFKCESVKPFEIVAPASIIPVTRNHFSKDEIIIELKNLTVDINDVYGRFKEEIERIVSVAINKINATNNNSGTGQQSPISANPTLINLSFDSNDIVPLNNLLQILLNEKIELEQNLKMIHIRISSPLLTSVNVVELYRIQNSVTGIKKSLALFVVRWNDRVNEFVAGKKRPNPDNKLLLSSFINSLLPANSNFLNSSESKRQQSSDNLSLASGDLLGDDKCDESVSLSNQCIHASSCTTETNLESTITDESEPTIVSPTDPNSKPTTTTMSTSNKLSNLLTNKIISKVTTTNKTMENVEILTASTTSTSFAARFLTRNNEENYLSVGIPFDCANQVSSAIPNQPPPQMFEHYQLPTYRDISIIVRDKDPGSIIAYALTTTEYDQKLNEIVAATSKQDSSMVGNGKDLASNETSPTNKTEPIEGVFGTKSNATDPSQHIDIQYNDIYAKFYCQVYFAQLFRRFRSLVLTDGGNSSRVSIRESPPPSINNLSSTNFTEELYVHSLSSCIPWNALGGKSGSTFSKTKNQRFILKEVSKGELKHFLTFACDYIAYCERAALERCPSALVKVVGAYQISYKNTVTNKGSIHYILVMENLFYECNVTFIYDLKGSKRNRKVIIPTNQADETLGQTDAGSISEEQQMLNDQQQSQQQSNSNRNFPPSPPTISTQVLMDENLRTICTMYPLYLQPHAKRFMMEAISRDSDFLRNHCVMDYSLLVGFDEEHHEYVIGIIDYVSLFNWEKILEFRVKKIANPIDPTVVHPKNYQDRFLDAMFNYFTEVPDKWYPFLRFTPLAGHYFLNDSSKKEDEQYSNSQHHNTRTDNDNNEEFVII